MRSGDRGRGVKSVVNGFLATCPRRKFEQTHQLPAGPWGGLAHSGGAARWEQRPRFKTTCPSPAELPCASVSPGCWTASCEDTAPEGSLCSNQESEPSRSAHGNENVLLSSHGVLSSELLSLQ
uniref:Uncharacterized protein n=1 Tax=Molossus molossus TaxID=27622 RepID=A0A7J8HI07_MOLMO|nr:hypothetical protein HJG59_010920 [Molossus molossus]